MVAKKAAKNAAKKKSVTKKSVKKSVNEEVVPAGAASDESKPSRCGSVCALLIGIAVIALIFVAIYFLPQWRHDHQVEQDKYNEFTFFENGGLWYVNIEVNGNPFTVVMHYHASEVDFIPVDPSAVDLVNAFANKASVGQDVQAYITMDPTAPAGHAIAGVELAKVLGEKFNIYNIPTKAAFAKPLSGNDSVPTVTCQNADNNTLVIYIREAEDDRVGVVEGYPQCIIVQGTDANETIKAADRFVYGLFGVI